MTTPPVGLPCPVCRVDLVMSDRQGIEIDYCPKCRGVWLDRGELDKIIERNSKAQGGATGVGGAGIGAAGAATTPPLSAPGPDLRPARDGASPWRDPQSGDYRESAGYRERWGDDDDDDRRDGDGRPKRRGFLAEIFDFD